MKCVRVDRNDKNEAIYEEAALRIASDLLVAFPTETVYGLGGNGLSVKAVSGIFEMKKRPLDDPVILHVNTIEDAVKLWNLDATSQTVIELLQNEFWPGPVTIIAPASEIVPSEVTANTGRVAVRCPSHPVARRLISAAGVPIAAPSANLFSRISPTRAEHVKKYFSDQDLLILECDDCCNIGIESTVLSIEVDAVRVLRSGAITQDHLRSLFAQKLPEVSVIARELLVSDGSTRPNSHDGSESTSTEKSAPGQCLVHYAPLITTTLCIGGIPRDYDISRCAVVDMSGKFECYTMLACYYRCIGQAKSSDQVARNLFATLHEIEDRSGAEELLICISSEDASKAEFAGVLDRSLRAAAHRVLYADKPLIQ